MLLDQNAALVAERQARNRHRFGLDLTSIIRLGNTMSNEGLEHSSSHKRVCDFYLRILDQHTILNGFD